MKILPFLLAVLPLGAQAEIQPAVAELMHYTADVAPCFAAAETSTQAEACIGVTSSTCMETEDDRFSTLGMMFCTLAEYEAWDVELNRAYQATMDELRRQDAQEAESFPGYAVRAEKMRDAQRAWIPLRDADCGLEYALWGSGSIRQIAGASCLMDLTARRAIYVKFVGSRQQ